MKVYKYIFTAVLVLFMMGCEDVLDLHPTNKLSGEELFSDPGGVRLYMANLYYQLPVEDFTYFPRVTQHHGGADYIFNYSASGPNNGGFAQVMHTDDAIHSEFNERTSRDDYNHWWTQGYKLIRDVNTLIGVISDLDILEPDRKLLVGETAFIRAYAYFALAKRYGGVPLIMEAQEYTNDIESLKVPRSTEEDTWNFVLAECDTAIANLAEGSGSERRATKWAAYALKSRAALHAASLAKYWDRSPMSGTAVNNKLVGLDPSLANGYYEACIKASAAIMNSSTFGLYMPNPSTPEEAAENYRILFEDPNLATEEAIFIKGYAVTGDDRTANNYEIWFNPNQLSNGWPHPGRMNPTLELADLYEDYNSPGDTSLLKTVVDGNENYEGYDPAQTYIHYDSPNGIYENKDARLWGTAILPGTMWKNNEIVIQAGYIEPNGTATLLTKTKITVNDSTYHTYGAPDASGYSGFDVAGGNHTRTGLSFKKFLNEAVDVNPAWNMGTIDFMDFRYAEILLNYAEAVVESDYSADNAPEIAKNAINNIRKRAAHTTEVELTLGNVLRERRVELCFENKRFWDLIRRREFHSEFNSRERHALLPVLDLREDPPTYIFVRDAVAGPSPETWEPKHYYRYIVGTGSNGLINNPMY